MRRRFTEVRSAITADNPGGLIGSACGSIRQSLQWGKMLLPSAKYCSGMVHNIIMAHCYCTEPVAKLRMFKL